MATTSFTALIQELATRLYPGRVVKGTTTSKVDSESVLDTANLTNSDANANQYNGVFVRIDEKVGSGPDVGEYQRVTDAGYAGSTADLTTGAFTASVESGTDFSLHYTLRPVEEEDIINLVLSNAHHQTYHPLSIITNYDYENATAGAPDNWTATDCGVTQTSTAAKVSYGRYCMRVLNTDTSGHGKSAAVKCNEGQSFFVWVSAQVVVGTATLIAYDEDGTANIETAATVQEGSTELAFTFTIPPDCKEFTIRLQGTGASDDVYWGPVVLFPRSRVVFDLPSFIDNPNRLNGVSWFRLGTGSVGSSEDLAHRSYETIPEPLFYRPVFDPLQANPSRVQVDVSGVSGPVFLYGWRPFAELTEANTSPTTLMDHDTLIAGALAEAHKRIAARLDTVDPGAAQTHRRLERAFTGDYRELLDSQGYAPPMAETQIVLPRRVRVRLP